MPSQVIEILMDEHQVILKVLGSMETMINALEKGERVERDTVKKYAEFLRNFADKCHHGKEEDRLFVKMNDFGIPRGDGPLAVMLYEHDAGRAHVRALLAIGEKSGPLTSEERKEVIEHARDFSDLLQNHIMKEDRILYPMAEKAIPGQELEKLYDDFEQFEKEVTGEGEHEKWHTLAQDLIRAYPPETNRF
ncbi:MAG: hemerythrin domain-containing protein [Thermodesulfobacteriota bacterium]